MSAIAQDWTQLPGLASDISIKGDEMWIIGSKGNGVYRWNGEGWTQKPGKGVRIAASRDGWAWLTTSDDSIYRFNKNKQVWDLMPGKLRQISAASKDSAFGVAGDMTIWLWKDNQWNHQPGAATWAAIGEDDDRWVVASDQTIYRWNHKNGAWDNIPGAAKTIDVQNADRVIVATADSHMYYWSNNAWHLMTGGCWRATLNYDTFYCIHTAEGIYKGVWPAGQGTTAVAQKECAECVCPQCQQRACPAQAVQHDEVDEEFMNVIVIYRYE
jgi:hypothetical protein